MAVSDSSKSQVGKKQDELVKKLQAEARMLFYDRMMYDINDSLTSILAVCEIDPKEAIPKVKEHIHRINQLLTVTKKYQHFLDNRERFDISLLLRNLMRVLKENYRENKLTRLITEIKAPVHGDQSKCEQLLLHIFVALLGKKDSDSEVLVELRQKDQNAQIIILKDNFTFSGTTLEQIEKIREEDGFRGSAQINPRGKGVEVIIKLPLQFQVINVRKPILKKISVHKKSLGELATPPVSPPIKN